MSSLFINPFSPLLGLTGLPAGAATVTFYLTGTTTLATVYDDDGDPLTNPVHADAFGHLPAIYLDDAIIYRVVYKTALGVVLGDIDPVASAIQSLSTATGASKIGLKRLEAGTSLETLQDWARRFVFPQSWGVKGDGTTNDQPAMQNMINSLSGGETIIIGAMRIRMNSVLRIGKTFSFVGRARENVSYFIAGSATSNLIEVYDDGSGTCFEKIHFDTAVARTAGSYIDFYNCNRNKVVDCRMDNHAFGITASLCRTLTVRDCFFRLCVPKATVALSSSIQLGANGYTESINISGCVAQSQQSPDVYGDAYQPYTWLDLLYCDNINVTDCSPQYQGVSVSIRPGTDQFVAFLNMTGGVYDTSRQSLLIKPNGGFVSRLRFHHLSFVAAHITASVELDGTVDLTGNNTFKTISDVAFENCSAINSVDCQKGIYFHGPHIDGVDILSCYTGNNGDGVSLGIDIDLQGGTNIRVMDCYMGARGGTPASEIIGLNVGTGITGGYSRLYSKNVPTPMTNGSSGTFTAL